MATWAARSRLAPYFDEQPIVTALGLGAVFKDQVAHITKRHTMAA